jgi:hypothetical protein
VKEGIITYCVPRTPWDLLGGGKPGDLFAALHHVDCDIRMDVMVRKIDEPWPLPDTYRITKVVVKEGSHISDLYDFNYDNGGLPQRAASVQIGWDPKRKGREAGKVFRVVVEVDQWWPVSFPE